MSETAIQRFLAAEADMIESDEGQYVLLFDHQSALAEAQREVERLRGELKELDQAGYRDGQKLAAENANLRRSLDGYREEAQQLAEYVRKLGTLLGCADGDDTPEMRIEALRRELEEAHVQLAALGDLAVADCDNSTVGKVDAIVKEPTKYKDRLRAIFVDIPAQRDDLQSRVEEMEKDRERLDFIEEEKHCILCLCPSERTAVENPDNVIWEIGDRFEGNTVRGAIDAARSAKG